MFQLMGPLSDKLHKMQCTWFISSDAMQKDGKESKGLSRIDLKQASYEKQEHEKLATSKNRENSMLADENQILDDANLNSALRAATEEFNSEICCIYDLLYFKLYSKQHLT